MTLPTPKTTAAVAAIEKAGNLQFSIFLFRWGTLLFLLLWEEPDILDAIIKILLSLA